jgi:hypothetical protein
METISNENKKDIVEVKKEEVKKEPVKRAPRRTITQTVENAI